MIVIHPAAAAEAQAARAWYARRDTAVGERFLAEFDRAVEQVRDWPHRWPTHPHVPGFRWFHFKRFPYAVIYEVLPDATHVLAVAADRRRPGYWLKRHEVTR